MRRKEYGFSLIEVLVAFMILAMSLTVLLRIFSTGLGNVALSGDYTEALLVAETQLASAGVSEPLTVGASEGEWDKRYRWQRIVEPYYTGADTSSPASPVSAFQVRVSVEWIHKGQAREISISSLRLRKNPALGRRG